MSQPARAVIFDLDDTLYLERDFARSGYESVATAFAQQLGPADKAIAAMLRQLDSANRRRVFDAALAQLGIPAEPGLVRAMIDHYRKHIPRIGLCADAERVLQRLQGTARLGLITDGPRTTQANKIAALGLRTRMKEIILTDELGPGLGKPHPRAFESIAAALDVAPAQCTYIADNPAKDFIAPNALGWSTIQIKRPGGLYVDQRPPPGGAAQRVILSLDEWA